jgi:hypothetical protein
VFAFEGVYLNFIFDSTSEHISSACLLYNILKDRGAAGDGEIFIDEERKVFDDPVLGVVVLVLGPFIGVEE